MSSMLTALERPLFSMQIKQWKPQSSYLEKLLPFTPPGIPDLPRILQRWHFSHLSIQTITLISLDCLLSSWSHFPHIGYQRPHLPIP